MAKNAERKQCNVCAEECKELKTCNNLGDEGDTACQYMMCESCLGQISEKLDNKCPQCRKEILSTTRPENIEQYTNSENPECCLGKTTRNFIIDNCCFSCIHLTCTFIIIGCNAVMGVSIIYVFNPSVVGTLSACRCQDWCLSMYVGMAMNCAGILCFKTTDSYCRSEYNRPLIDENNCGCCCCKYANMGIRAYETMVNREIAENEEMERE